MLGFHKMMARVWLCLEPAAPQLACFGGVRSRLLTKPPNAQPQALESHRDPSLTAHLRSANSTMEPPPITIACCEQGYGSLIDIQVHVHNGSRPLYPAREHASTGLCCGMAKLFDK